MFVKRKCTEQLKPNLKRKYNIPINVCMKAKKLHNRHGKQKYAIYIYYTPIISILTLHLKSSG